MNLGKVWAEAPHLPSGGAEDQGPLRESSGERGKALAGISSRDRGDRVVTGSPPLPLICFSLSSPTPSQGSFFPWLPASLPVSSSGIILFGRPWRLLFIPFNICVSLMSPFLTPPGLRCITINNVSNYLRRIYLEPSFNNQTPSSFYADVC